MRNGLAGKSSRVTTLSACALVKGSEKPGFLECRSVGAFGGTLFSVFVEGDSFDSIDFFCRVLVTLLLSMFMTMTNEYIFLENYLGKQISQAWDEVVAALKITSTRGNKEIITSLMDMTRLEARSKSICE